MEGFTEDAFKCGLCNEEKFSIDEYVGHMLEKEECIMVLETSKYLQGMVLPRLVFFFFFLYLVLLKLNEYY